MWPHRQQATRLPCHWGSPGKNTGVGCHFLLQYMKVKSENEVTQSCPTPSDSMDCSLPGSSISMIFQARVLEWVAIAFSERFSMLSKLGTKFMMPSCWGCAHNPAVTTPWVMQYTTYTATHTIMISKTSEYPPNNYFCHLSHEAPRVIFYINISHF